MTAWWWVAVATVIVATPIVVAWAIARAAAQGDAMIERLNQTEGDG